MLTLERLTEKYLRHGVVDHDQRNQKVFMESSEGYEKGLRDMINGLELYCRAYEKESGNKIGLDFYLAPLLEEIASSMHDLLSGPGRFSGGTLSSAIYKICEDADLTTPSGVKE